MQRNFSSNREVCLKALPSQSLLPSPLKSLIFTSPNKTGTHTLNDSTSHASISYKSYTENFFLCVQIVIILILPIYIFLYINSLKVCVLLFHFTQLYTFYTSYTFIWIKPTFLTIVDIA